MCLLNNMGTWYDCRFSVLSFFMVPTWLQIWTFVEASWGDVVAGYITELEYRHCSVVWLPFYVDVFVLISSRRVKFSVVLLPWAFPSPLCASTYKSFRETGAILEEMPTSLQVSMCLEGCRDLVWYFFTQSLKRPKCCGSILFTLFYPLTFSPPTSVHTH